MNSQGVSTIDTGEESIRSPFASFLRFIGACLLVAGAIAYLLEGWHAVGHISRYYKFLGITGLLAVTGVVTGIGLKEARGARTFLALALAAIPVNFCQLGALLYSVVPGGTVPAGMQSYLVWQAPGMTNALVTCLVGSVSLAGIAWLAFSVLGRQQRSRLVTSTFLLNALLLIPLRTIESTCVLGCVAFAIAFVNSVQLRRNGAFASTLEASLCRLTLWVPGVIILLRTALLYEYSSVVTGILSLFIGGMLVSAARSIEKNNGLRDLLEFTAGLMLIAGSLIELQVLIDALGFTTSREQTPIIAMALIAAGAFLRRELNQAGRALAAVASTAACLIGILHGVFHNDLFASMLPMVLGGVVYSQGRVTGSQFLAWVGVLTFIVAGLEITGEMFEAIFKSWLGVSLAGIAVVLLGSFVEKGGIALFGRRLLQDVGLFRDEQ